MFTTRSIGEPSRRPQPRTCHLIPLAASTRNQSTSSAASSRPSSAVGAVRGRRLVGASFGSIFAQSPAAARAAPAPPPGRVDAVPDRMHLARPSGPAACGSVIVCAEWAGRDRQASSTSSRSPGGPGRRPGDVGHREIAEVQEIDAAVVAAVGALPHPHEVVALLRHRDRQHRILAQQRMVVAGGHDEARGHRPLRDAGRTSPGRAEPRRSAAAIRPPAGRCTLKQSTSSPVTTPAIVRGQRHALGRRDSLLGSALRVPGRAARPGSVRSSERPSLVRIRNLSAAGRAVGRRSAASPSASRRRWPAELLRPRSPGSWKNSSRGSARSPPLISTSIVAPRGPPRAGRSRAIVGAAAAGRGRRRMPQATSARRGTPRCNHGQAQGREAAAGRPRQASSPFAPMPPSTISIGRLPGAISSLSATMPRQW